MRRTLHRVERHLGFFYIQINRKKSLGGKKENLKKKKCISQKSRRALRQLRQTINFSCPHGPWSYFTLISCCLFFSSNIHFWCALQASLRWLYCLTIIGCNFVFNDLLHQHWYQTMDLGLPFHSCTFDDITMTSSQVLGEILFFYNSLFFEKMEPPIKFELCKQHKHHIREDVYSRMGGIFIRNTARDTAYSLWFNEVEPYAPLNHNEYAVSRAVSRMKMLPVREYASSLISETLC